MKAHYQ